MRRFVIVVLSVLVGFVLSESLFRTYYYINKHRLTSLKAKDGFDLYVVGESTTAGYPYCLNSAISFPEIVKKMYQNQIKDQKLKIHMLAVPGEPISPQVFRFQQAMQCRDSTIPGVVFLYAGQNEGYLGHSIQTPPLQNMWLHAYSHSFALSALQSVLEKNFFSLRIRTLNAYEFHLRQIIESSFRHGLTPIISTVVSNTADIEPGLFWTGRLSKSEIVSFIKKGEVIEGTKNFPKAIDYYRKISQDYPEVNGYMKFRMGKCYEQLGNYLQANRYYGEATDTNISDSFSRAIDLQNDLIRSLAKEYHVPLVEAVSLFKNHATHGLLGNELFIDGQHPNLKGYVVLAQGYANALSSLIGEAPKISFTTIDDVYRSFFYSPKQQANPYLICGKWLLTMSRRHAYPRWRLDLAAKNCNSAVALDPDRFSAWLFLGIIEASQKNHLLQDEKVLQQLDSYGFFDYYKLDLAPTMDQLHVLMAELHDWGVSPSILNRISQTYSRKVPQAN